MNSLLFGLMLGCGLAGAIAGIFSWRAFDKIVWAEYRQHRTQWESDGRPCGFFWMPHEGDLGGIILRSLMLISWMFARPKWSRSDAALDRLFETLRLCGVLQVLSIPAVIFLLVALQ